MDDLTIAGLLVLIVGAAIREIFGWMKQKNLMNSEQRLRALEEQISSMKEQNTKLKEECFEPLKSKIDTLYEWHDKSDQDGVKIWYV